MELARKVHRTHWHADPRGAGKVHLAGDSADDSVDDEVVGKTHKVATAVTAWSSSDNFMEFIGARTLVARAKSILRETARATASTNDDENDRDASGGNDDDDGAPLPRMVSFDRDHAFGKRARAL